MTPTAKKLAAMLPLGILGIIACKFVEGDSGPGMISEHEADIGFLIGATVVACCVFVVMFYRPSK